MHIARHRILKVTPTTYSYNSTQSRAHSEPPPPWSSGVSKSSKQKAEPKLIILATLHIAIHESTKPTTCPAPVPAGSLCGLFVHQNVSKACSPSASRPHGPMRAGVVSPAGWRCPRWYGARRRPWRAGHSSQGRQPLRRRPKGVVCGSAVTRIKPSTKSLKSETLVPEFISS